MSQIQNYIDLKSLLAIIGVLSAGNIALIIFIAKKYIKRADRDHERIDALETEHKVFHKDQTGIS